MIDVRLPLWIQKYLNTPKKCSKELRTKFITEMSVLYDSMNAGVALVGDLTGHYKIDFCYKGIDYRIIYSILSDEEVLIVYCGTRENVYKKVKRKL